MLFLLKIFDMKKNNENCDSRFVGELYYKAERIGYASDSIDEIRKTVEKELTAKIVDDRLKSRPIFSTDDSLDDAYNDSVELEEYGDRPADYTLILDIDPDKELMLSCTDTTRRNVTLPIWLDLLGKEAQVNFSQTLQDALIEKLGIRDRVLSNLGLDRSTKEVAKTVTPGRFIIEVKEEV